MESPDLAAIRTEYPTDGLLEEHAGDDPIALVDRWLADALVADLVEPNAMALATADAAGRPSVRTVLLKGFDARGPVFFTHGTSRKGRDLAANPWASAVMLWHPMHRQIRFEGRAEPIDPAESQAYFESRPRGSQLGAVASDQSQPIADRGALERQYAEAEAAAADGPVTRPPAWGGFRIVPLTIEFWSGRSSRLHDRLVFTRADVGAPWTRTRLQP